MYNNFFVQKQKKKSQIKHSNESRLKNWVQNYHHKVQPYLLDRYNQRVNSFITKIQENPSQLIKFQAADIRKQKQQHMKQKISQLSRKGGRMFKYRDATDFNSYFSEAERIQRQKNKSVFYKKYGDAGMAYRSIASQSSYNPSLMNQFRSRKKQKQINPPMKYTHKYQNQQNQRRRALSVLNKRSKNLNSHTYNLEENENLVRKNTSYTNSLIGNQDELRSSVNSIKDQDQSSQQSQKNLKKFSVTLQNPSKIKKKQSSKSYFIGITDIKQNSQDPHVKKTLHNILVKIGKTHPNPRDKSLLSNIQVLSTDIN